jgi:ferredoxin-type protein NapG
MNEARQTPSPATPRRRFLKEMAGAAGGACLLALGVGLYGEEASARPATAIRPPGALAEEDFLAACVRCGLCVRDCPYDTLKLSTLGEHIATGTPYFEPRKVACEMCEDIPCVAACPTGALDHDLVDIREARMGLAALVDHETCLNFLGLRCDVCYRVCPVIDKAITLELTHNPRSDRHAMLLPTVHSDACTGCGKCERSCVLPEAAIKVLPFTLAQGKAAEHYRKGWEEKARAGGSLIGPQEQLPMRGLEDRAYGDTRIAPGEGPQAAPRPAAPGGVDSEWKP